jgi:hypothetical protein
MSLLARLESNDHAAFEELAQALLSQDNTARKQAEEFYKDLVKHKPDITLRYLINGLAHNNADMKHFCCVYLRKVRSGAPDLLPISMPRMVPVIPLTDVAG